MRRAMRNLGKRLEFICQEWIRIARRKSKENLPWSIFLMTVVSATFGALSEVQLMHAIYHFKSQEVNNPMLQTMLNSELKRGSYSHCKSITLSWKKHFGKCCEITLLLRNDFAAFLYSVVDFLLKLPDICDDYYQKVLFRRPNYNGFKHLWVVIIFI